MKRTFDNRHSIVQLAQPLKIEKESDPSGVDPSRSRKDLPAKNYSTGILIQETDVRELPTSDMVLHGNF